MWEGAQELAFTNLKKALVNDPILKLPDLSKEFILQCDASEVGVGASLLQEHGGTLFPVAYASKKFLARERKYSTIEKECLSLVFGVKKFEVYLYGKPFTLQTDHQPLIYLNTAKVSNDRIMRWALFLQRYMVRIEAIKGSHNVVADFLSRSECSYHYF